MPSLIPSSEDVRIYECAVLYPLLTQKDEAALLKEVEGLFDEAGAKLVAKDNWGRRGLAYSIKGQMEGNYIVYYYEVDPLKLKEIDQQMRIMKNLMRHMFVKPPKHYQILKYSELYTQWLKERETMDQKKTREKEAQVAERLTKKVQMQAKRAPKKVAEEKPAGPVVQEELTEKLEKLVSDDITDL